METASPTLFFPPSAAPGYRPPLRPQGSLPRSLRDGPTARPWPRSLYGPSPRSGTGRRTAPARPNRTALGSYQDQTPTNKVSTVSGDCHCQWWPIMRIVAGWARSAVIGWDQRNTRNDAVPAGVFVRTGTGAQCCEQWHRHVRAL